MWENVLITINQRFDINSLLYILATLSPSSLDCLSLILSRSQGSEHPDVTRIRHGLKEAGEHQLVSPGTGYVLAGNLCSRSGGSPRISELVRPGLCAATGRCLSLETSAQLLHRGQSPQSGPQLITSEIGAKPIANLLSINCSFAELDWQK